MAVTVKLKFVRHSARKLRPVLQQFVGKPLEVSIDRTAVASNDSARMLNKALRMARAAASEKEFQPGNMVISEAFATEGPRIKRIRANARGRANRYQKHLAHITVMLKESDTKVETKTSASTKPAKTKVATTVRSKK